jgi:transposase
VFGVGAATRIYLAPGATDMRKGFNGLYGLVRDQLLCDPLSGHLFLFANAQRNRLKVLFWDTTGLWVCAKKLEEGRFHWPAADDAQSRGVCDVVGRHRSCSRATSEVVSQAGRRKIETITNGA